MSEEMISANIWLAGRSYRIRIHPEEEEAVRKAAKLADDKIVEMRSHYAGKDDQDFIAMCLLTYAADSATGTFHDPVLKNELQEITKKLDHILDAE